MTEPCSKEEVLKKLSDGAETRTGELLTIKLRQVGVVESVEHIRRRSDEHRDKTNSLEIKLIELSADTRRIKEIVSNGLSSNVGEIHDKLIALEPVIQAHAEYIRELRQAEVISKNKRHEKWVSRLENACVLSMYVIGFAIIGVIVWAISKGFKP